MHNRLMVFLATILACSAMTGLAFGQTCQDVHGVTGFAPSPLEGSEITLTGVVYVAPGTFNETEVYFQCPGGLGGMEVLGPELPGLVNLGDEISVTGIVGASVWGNVEFGSGSVVTVLSHGNQSYPPPWIGTAELDEGSNLIGGLLRVQGLLTSPWDTSGYNKAYQLNDGSGPVVVWVYGNTGLTEEDFELMLGGFVEITGASNSFDNQGQILPRSIGDIKTIAVPTRNNTWSTLKATY